MRRCGGRCSSTRQTRKRSLLAELERLAEAHGLPHDPPGVFEVFRVASRELLRFVPPSRLSEPSYFTAEGDPVVAARATWSLVDPDDAFAVLDAPPELLWVGESEDGAGECFQLTGDRAEQLARRPPLPPNALFFESSYEGFPDRIGLGTFVLGGSELRFDAISEQRLAHALDLVASRLAGNAKLLEREVAPLALDRHERRQALQRGEEAVLASSYLEEYLRRWLDEPLERLDGLTPRAAAAVPKLRGQLELLAPCDREPRRARPPRRRLLARCRLAAGRARPPLATRRVARAAQTCARCT